MRSPTKRILQKLGNLLLLLSLGYLALLPTERQALGLDEASRKIVIFTQPLSSKEQELNRKIEDAGATVVKWLPLVNGASVRVPDKLATQRLAASSGVVRVDDDLVLQAVDGTAIRPQAGTKGQVTTQPPQRLPWGVDRIDADLAWGGGTVTGLGIKVAVLDTGIDLAHPDLNANIKGGYNALNPHLKPNDDNGHGTHVAGIIAAADNGIGVVGVAPQAGIYAVKVLNSNGSGYLSDLIEGLDWAVRNGINVINLSLGTSTDNQTFHDAISRVYNAGITVVAAAGNAGPNYGTVLYPAKYSEVIAVSASDQADQQPSWSSWGPEVDLAAPGAGIYSTYIGGTYATLSGTSMAAPHVTGTVTIMLAKWGVMSPDAVQAYSLLTGESVSSLIYPLIDTWAAVNTVPIP